MSIPLRYNTASQEILLGYFVDSTDGNTEETALTIANTDIKLFKTGATTLASKNSGGATHISNGLYYAVLDATDTNTLGPMVVSVHVAGALSVRLACCVYPAEVYDTLFLGTDSLTTDLTAAALLLVNAEVDTALNTAIPVGPTADSINERVKAIDDLTQASGGGDLAAVKTAVVTSMPATLATIATDTTTDIPATLATLGTAANLALVKADTAAILVDTGTTLDANLTAVKAKTDSLAFTVAGVVDANVQRINDVTILGTGATSDKFTV